MKWIVLFEANFWTASGTVVIAFATIAQAYVTWRVAQELKQASVIRERQSNSRYINEQWQKLNLLSVTNNEFRDTVSHLYESGIEKSEITTRGIVFYILNILYDMFNAKQGYIDKSYYATMTNEHVKLLYTNNPDELMRIIDGERGYSPEFRRHIKDVLRDLNLI